MKKIARDRYTAKAAITLHLPEEMRVQLDEIAFQEDRSISSVVRLALSKFLKEACATDEKNGTTFEGS